MKEYNIEQGVKILYYDDLIVINISKNHVEHSRTKNIDIHHHFIGELVKGEIVNLEQVATEK